MTIPVHMRRYPYLAVYASDHEYAGVVVMVERLADATVIYLPEGITAIALWDRVSPAESSITEYTGSVVLRNSKDPELGG